MRFLFVHGGFHGAWCWSQLIPELERLGHQAMALDLPGHGVRRDERSTLADRRNAILDLLEPGDVLREFFYHDCDQETAAWAFARLTPAPTEFLVETVSLPRFWKAELPRSYIRCLQDRAKPHSMSDDVIRRLGVSPLTIDASHSPFLSRPAELAELFVHAITTRPIGPLKPA